MFKSPFGIRSSEKTTFNRWCNSVDSSELFVCFLIALGPISMTFVHWRQVRNLMLFDGCLGGGGGRQG